MSTNSQVISRRLHYTGLREVRDLVELLTVVPASRRLATHHQVNDLRLAWPELRVKNEWMPDFKTVAPESVDAAVFVPRGLIES